jgi:hypothetical protein
MVRSTSVTAVVLAAGLIVAAPAEAAKWRGKTRQGRGAFVHTGPDGVVNYAKIRYIAPCGDGKALRSGVVFTPTFDLATTTDFVDGGPMRFRAGPERVRARVRIVGGLRRSGRWTGTFHFRARIFRNGQLVTTCRLKRVGWKASPV